jgi:hypothetical protein
MGRRASHVTLSGDLSGSYVVTEERDDGALCIRPDTSMGRSTADSV